MIFNYLTFNNTVKSGDHIKIVTVIDRWSLLRGTFIQTKLYGTLRYVVVVVDWW
jgi:hypothetical protein